jgi:protocatechuate 3,4-dioxygenase alpha subunit
MNPVATPGQTVGPFFGYALEYDGGPDLVPTTHPDAIRLHGRVLDGAGQPVPDALIELWQADPDGRVVREAGSLRRDGSTFTGWGRAATDAAGVWSFTTLVPGAPAPGRAAYFGLTVFARGLLDRLFTRAYLPGDGDVLAADPLLAAVGDRRHTLVAAADGDGFAFDIRLQGDAETVFLAYPRD